MCFCQDGRHVGHSVIDLPLRSKVPCHPQKIQSRQGFVFFYSGNMNNIWASPAASGWSQAHRSWPVFTILTCIFVLDTKQLMVKHLPEHVGPPSHL